MSRKRPAPGTSPSFQTLPQNQQYGIPDSQLSDDEFLQWGQGLQHHTQANQMSESATYNPVSYTGNGDVQTANQIMRSSPSNQLVPRVRAQNDVTVASEWTQNDTRAGSVQREGTEEDDLEDLKEKAEVSKKEALAKRKQIPPFVQKLSSFLDEKRNTELIRWSDDGKSFIVEDEDEFAKTLIPELFKHNNYASFVRQLNMYGFHKKVGLADNSMRASERKNKSPSEYSNQFFRRGHPELLWLITKPKNVPTTAVKGKGRSRGDQNGGSDENEDIEEVPAAGQTPRQRLIEQAQSISPGAVVNNETINRVKNELSLIRNQQQIISHTIQQLRLEHQQMASQAATFAEQHNRHENSINAILTFLATVYNRSLQSPEGASMANLFSTAMPHETSQGNVVDVGDYGYEPFTNNDVSSLQPPFKKQPLLLQAPPRASNGQQGRAATMSPSTAGNSPYEGRQTRKMSQAMRNNQNQIPSGTIEEVYEPYGNGNSSNMQSDQSNASDLPQRDIMSIIRNANARNLSNGKSKSSDVPSALSSLESVGGNSPLTASQRADMLRMINDSANQPMTQNNALISPNPPAMPSGYDARLASTRAEIDKLARMQAEQDKSVQNLERLLQPLSPNGNIPGIAGDQEVQMPTDLDLDQIFNSSDYFGDPNASSMFGDVKPLPGGYNSGPENNYFPTNNEPFDDELFSGVNTTKNGLDGQNQNGVNEQQQQRGDDGSYGYYFPQANNVNKNSGNDQYEGDNTGRVESVGSSEATTPKSTLDEERSPLRKRRRNG